MTQSAGRTLLGILVLGVVSSGSVEARDNLDTERALADVMIGSRNARSFAERPTQGILAEIVGSWPDPRVTDSALPEEETRSWAVLPQVGFSPDRGINAGMKFVDRALGTRQLTLDLGGIFAVEGQQAAELTLVAPELWSRRFLAVLEADYARDPAHEFFGLGNNEVGPDALSTHEQEFLTGLFTIGFRPIPRLTLAFSMGFSEMRIRRGELEDDTPSTVDAFPELTGIDGGRVNPLAVSVVFNNREDLTRPTRGWSFVAKVQHVPRWFANDFEYTRYVLDASYLLPLPTRQQVLGIRLGGEFIDAAIRDVPFFEMSALGGDRTLRGFFQDRFLGLSRVMVNAEYRFQVVTFQFFDLWDVKIDAVGFGDLGRVFLEDDELERQFRIDEELLPRLFQDFRLSWGGGTRIALGDALLARIDVGFSEEETALLYLTFGHTF